MARNRLRIPCYRLLLLLGVAHWSTVAPAQPRHSSPPIPKAGGWVARASESSGPWRLTVRRDRFSGAVRCSLGLRNGRAVYRLGAAGFRLGADRPVGEAAIRIDDAAPLAYRDLFPALAQLRVAVEDAGSVWIPNAMLEGAQRLWIAPHFGARPRYFPLEGLVALSGRARAAGCASEAQFD